MPPYPQHKTRPIATKVETKDVQRQRQDDDEQQHQRHEADEFRAIEEARVDHDRAFLFLFPNFESEEPLRPHHQDRDDRQ